MSSVDTNGKNVVCDLDQSFSCIVLGAAENFGGDDIASGAPINALVKYVKEDNDLILFHDTLTASIGKITNNMTRNLASLFGQNARHFVQDTAGVEKILTNQTLKIKYKLDNQEIEKNVDLPSSYGKSSIVIKEDSEDKYTYKNGLDQGHSLNITYGNDNKLSTTGLEKDVDSFTYKIVKSNKLYTAPSKTVYQYWQSYTANSNYSTRGVQVYNNGTGWKVSINSYSYTITKNSSGKYSFTYRYNDYSVDLDNRSENTNRYIHDYITKPSYNLKIYTKDRINGYSGQVDRPGGYIFNQNIASDSSLLEVKIKKQNGSYETQNNGKVIQTMDTDDSTTFKDVRMNITVYDNRGNETNFDYNTELYAVINDDYQKPINLNYKSDDG